MEERITDQIIAGTKFPELQKQLLSKNEAMSGSEVLNTWRSYEASIKYMRQMGELQGKCINQISAIKHRREDTDNCGKCGLKHKNGNCPARGSTCSACGRKNHWARMCHNKKPKTKNKNKKRTGIHRRTDLPNQKSLHQFSMYKNLRNSINVQDQVADEFEKMSFYSMEDHRKEVLSDRGICLIGH